MRTVEKNRISKVFGKSIETDREEREKGRGGRRGYRGEESRTDEALFRLIILIYSGERNPIWPRTRSTP